MKEETFSKEDLKKVFTYSLYTLWSLTCLVTIWKILSPQIEMSTGEDLFLYTFQTTNYLAFCFLSLVICFDKLLHSLSSFKKNQSKTISIGLTFLLTFIMSFVVSYENLFFELSMAHISINEYRRCDDGYEYGYKKGIRWIVVSKKISDCSRLGSRNQTYASYKKSIERLASPPKYVATPVEQNENRPQVAVTPTEEVLVSPEPETTPSTPGNVAKDLPRFKLAHRFLYYGEGDVMISDFKYLPASVLKEIEKVRKKKATKEYKKTDLSNFLPEILKAYGLEKYKGISYKGEVQFNFTKVTLVHSLEKGDCTNYPDTYISLVSEDFTKKINGKDVIGYPDTEFMVFPLESKRITDKKAIKMLNKKMSHVYQAGGPLSYQPEYYHVGEKIYALYTEIEMGVSYDVFDCTRECIKGDYYVDYPSCGF